MVLSFITAALLMMIQARGSSVDAASPTVSEGINEGASPIVAAPIPAAPVASVEPAKPRDAASMQTSIQMGVAAVLQPALPVVGMAQSLALVVDLSERQVFLYEGGVLQTQYPIAIGREGWETPTGEFHVLSMQVDPIWQNPITGEIVPSGYGNPLGSRWIGFWLDGTHQIGFHGTYQEELIGQAVSHGCIRMRNADVEALYAQVNLGTPVTVIP